MFILEQELANHSSQAMQPAACLSTASKLRKVFTFFKHFFKKSTGQITDPLCPFTEIVCKTQFGESYAGHDDQEFKWLIWNQGQPFGRLWAWTKAVTMGIDLKDTKKVQLMGLWSAGYAKTSHKCPSWENNWVMAVTRQEKGMGSRLGREWRWGLIL